MSSPGRSAGPVAAAASRLLLGTLLSAPALGATIEIETYWVPAGENQFVFLVGEKELCGFSGRAPADATSTAATCRIELPAGAQSLLVRGRATLDVWDPKRDRTAAKTAVGQELVKLRDAAPLARPLRDASLPLAERWRRARAAEAELVKAWDGVPLIELEPPAAPAALAEAEKRLGFALPAGYRELVSQAGAVAFGDHAVPGPESLVTADRTILSEWGYGDEGVPSWMAPAALARLKRSVLLFFEVGDGMGAELYLAPPNAPCGDRFATLSFHEETLAEAMAELAADRLACEPFDPALLGLLERYLLLEHEWSLADATGELLVDSSAPVERFHLRYAIGDGGELEIDLSRE